MKRIALFMHEPSCDAQCSNGVIESLESKYLFKLFGKNEMEESFFDDVDAVLFPGGGGRWSPRLDADRRHRHERARR